MKDKIQKAVVDMMSKIDFDEDKHVYTHKKTGNWFQGVSEVSSIIPKDWLSAWGAKEAVKALGYTDYPEDTQKAEEMLEKIKSIENVHDFIELLKEAKGSHRKKSKDALIDGTAGHEWLEKYIKASIRGDKKPDVPKGNLKRPIEQFLKWEKENIDEWILSEARVAHEGRMYAGTLDALARLKNGKYAIIDFKFASHISEDYFLQTAGYLATFEEYDLPVKDWQRIIIRLPKTLEIDEWDKKTRSHKKVVNNIEIKVVHTPYEEDRDTFFNALPVKRWINKYFKN